MHRLSWIPLSALLLFGGVMLVPFLGLPPVGFGVFHQIEPLTVGIWVLGGLAAGWCLLVRGQRPDLMGKICAMPVVWAQLPFLVYVLVRGFFVASPLLSLAGTPHLAQGGLTFLALFFLTPPLVLLTKISPLRRVLFVGGTLSCLTLAALTILGSMDSPVETLRYWQWCPVFFPDYIAFGLIALCSLYWIFRPSFSRGTLFPLAYHLFFLVVLAGASYYSYNQSVFVAYALGIFTYLVVRFGPFQEVLSPQKRFALYVFLGLAALTLFLSTYDVVNPYLPAKLQNQASLTSRAYLAKMTFIDFFYRPVKTSYLIDFFFGQGWGGFNNATLSHLFLVNDISLFSKGTWRPTWEFLDRDLLHSHNMLLETFLASGLMGLLVFLYTKYKLIQGLGRSHLFAGIFFLTGYWVVSAFWFELLHTLPFVLVAKAFLLTRSSRGGLSLKGKGGGLFSAGCVGGLLLIPLALTLGGFVQHFSDLTLKKGDDLFDKVDRFIGSPLPDYDLLLGGFRSALVGRRLTSELKQTLAPPEKEDVSGKTQSLPSQQASYAQKTGQQEEVFHDPQGKPAAQEGQDGRAPQEVLQRYIQLAQKFLKGKGLDASLNALVLSLNLMTELASHEKTSLLFLENRAYTDLWDRAALRAQRLMPFRTDIMGVYLNHLLVSHQRQKLLELTGQALKAYPRDPIAYWYQGLVRLKTDSDPAQGLQSLKHAIELGVTRFLPIPQKEVETLLNATP